MILVGPGENITAVRKHRQHIVIPAPAQSVDHICPVLRGSHGCKSSFLIASLDGDSDPGQRLLAFVVQAVVIGVQVAPSVYPGCPAISEVHAALNIRKELPAPVIARYEGAGAGLLGIPGNHQSVPGNGPDRILPGMKVCDLPVAFRVCFRLVVQIVLLVALQLDNRSGNLLLSVLVQAVRILIQPAESFQDDRVCVDARALERFPAGGHFQHIADLAALIYESEGAQFQAVLAAVILEIAFVRQHDHCSVFPCRHVFKDSEAAGIRADEGQGFSGFTQQVNGDVPYAAFIAPLPSVGIPVCEYLHPYGAGFCSRGNAGRNRFSRRGDGRRIWSEHQLRDRGLFGRSGCRFIGRRWCLRRLRGRRGHRDGCPGGDLRGLFGVRCGHSRCLCFRGRFRRDGNQAVRQNLTDVFRRRVFCPQRINRNRNHDGSGSGKIRRHKCRAQVPGRIKRLRQRLNADPVRVVYRQGFPARRDFTDLQSVLVNAESALRRNRPYGTVLR